MLLAPGAPLLAEWACRGGVRPPERPHPVLGVSRRVCGSGGRGGHRVNDDFSGRAAECVGRAVDVPHGGESNGGPVLSSIRSTLLHSIVDRRHSEPLLTTPGRPEGADARAR